MKKVFLLATAALLITGVTFAHPGKKCCKKKGKTCCHKKAKSCCKKKAATVSM
jgi:hypothetical protein